MLQEKIKKTLLDGTVIPAHPLALNRYRKLDEKRQRALTKYYISCKAGGIAVGVHTTQFEIRNKKHDLYKPVLELAIDEVLKAGIKNSFIKVAGIIGPTEQAIKEAEIAAGLGYDLGLLSMGGLNGWSETALIERANKVSKIIPLFGFYLQPAVGGIMLSFRFWKNFVENANVHAIKIAPFNRYQTLDVIRAVCSSIRFNEIALYTGNDDNILYDLLTTYEFTFNGRIREKSIVGGLLGQWAVWTSRAVKLLAEIKKIKKSGNSIPTEIISKSTAMTDANGAIFDVKNNFKGCIPGIHEILRRQGLLQGNWCLNPSEKLSPGQKKEISRIYKEYPFLNDDLFVHNNLNGWIR